MHWNSLVSDVKACKWFAENTVSINKETIKSKGTTLRNFVSLGKQSLFIYFLKPTGFKLETTQQEAGESWVKASEDKRSGFYFSTFSF